jgi:hypothetical protein
MGTNALRVPLWFTHTPWVLCTRVITAALRSTLDASYRRSPNERIDIVRHDQRDDGMRRDAQEL